MEILKEKYSITELSEMLQLTDHTLRYYEKEFGLIVPKDERGRRTYPTSTANILYKIKVMRSDGLEIKAIRKILQEEIRNEPVPVSVMLHAEEDESAVILYDKSSTDQLQLILKQFNLQLTKELTLEIAASREHLSRQIDKTKLELGACVENSMRRIENKMEKHYLEIDRAISNWRERNKRNFFQRILFRLKN